jgi:hypothetical protein
MDLSLLKFFIFSQSENIEEERFIVDDECPVDIDYHQDDTTGMGKKIREKCVIATQVRGIISYLKIKAKSQIGISGTDN